MQRIFFAVLAIASPIRFIDSVPHVQSFWSIFCNKNSKRYSLIYSVCNTIYQIYREITSTFEYIRKKLHFLIDLGNRP